MVDEVSHDAFRYILKNLYTLDISWLYVFVRLYTAI